MRQIEGVCNVVLFYGQRPVLLSECRCHLFRLEYFYVFLFEEIPYSPLMSTNATRYKVMLREGELPAGFWGFDPVLRQKTLQEILNFYCVETQERIAV